MTLLISWQTSLPAAQITGGCRNVQHLQLGLFGQFIINTKVWRDWCFNDAQLKSFNKTKVKKNIYTDFFPGSYWMKLLCFSQTRIKLFLLIQLVVSWIFWLFLTVGNANTKLWHCLIFLSDYVQVVDMGTLELRITAVKPGADGKLVRFL